MKITLFIIIGIIISFYLNGYIQDYFIPNPCAFHTVSPPWYISLFFNFSIGNGGHPFPNLLNLGLTLTFGVLLGFTTNRVIKSKNK